MSQADSAHVVDKPFWKKIIHTYSLIFAYLGKHGFSLGFFNKIDKLLFRAKNWQLVYAFSLHIKLILHFTYKMTKLVILVLLNWRNDVSISLMIICTFEKSPDFYPSVRKNASRHRIFFISYPCALSTVLNPRDLAKKAIGEGGQLPNFFTNFQFLFNRKTCRNWTEIARSISVLSEIKSRSCPTSRNSWK